MSAKKKKLDESSGIYMPCPPPIDRSEIPAPYSPTESFEARYERDLAESVAWTLRGRESRGLVTRRADILNDRLTHSDINAAIRLELIYSLSDGTLSTLPQWGQIDPNAPTTADFTSLADLNHRTADGQDGADSERSLIGLYGAQDSVPVKPHHVATSRKDFGCFLCEKGIEHIRYLGVSRLTGYRLWSGQAPLVDLAKKLANWKGLYARSRPNGGNGFWLLTVEDDRRLDGLDPFADIDFNDLINS